MPRNNRNASSFNQDETFEEIFPRLSEDGQLIVSVLMNEFSKVHSQLASKNEEIACLKSEVNSLHSKVTNLESQIDEANAYERRDALVISGKDLPPSSNDENCSEIVKKLVKEKLRLEIDANSISTAHRLGKKDTNAQQDNRSIIVKLCRRETKYQIYSASRTIRNPGLYVNESLTPTRRTVLYALRQMKRAHPNIVKGCSSFDGKIFAYTKPETSSPNARNVRHLVNTREKLQLFCRDFIKKPLDVFVNSWPTDA